MLVAATLLLSWKIYRAPGVDLVTANLLAIPTFVALTAVGALIASRFPDNRFGWLSCGVGLLWTIGMVATSYTSYAFGVHDGDLPASRYASRCVAGCSTRISSALIFIPLLFPTTGCGAAGVRSSGWLWRVVCASIG
jgi:hypothetical protein